MRGHVTDFVLQYRFWLWDNSVYSAELYIYVYMCIFVCVCVCMCEVVAITSRM